MGRRVRLFIFFLATAFVSGFGPELHAASDWQVIKVGRWDYLSVDNVAKFYGFAGEVAPVNKHVLLDNGKNQLELTLDSREAIVNGVRNWLCFPVIEQGGKYLVSRIDLAKTIEPQFRPHMIPNLGRLKTIVLDPGHGGVENGASSSYGNEKDFTLDVALKLKPLLEAKGFRVVLTRDRDKLVPLQERARIANSTKDSIFVSLHFNAADTNGSANGFEIYSLTPRGAPSTQDNALLERFLNMQAGSPVDAPSLILSAAVYHSILGYMPEFDRGIKRARFAVLRLTNSPAILIEGGFLTERQESRLIATPLWREKLAKAISVGLDSYRGLVEKKQRPLMLADYRRQLDGVLVAHAPGTSPNDSSVVFPASNTLGSGAQITEPIRREPSRPISLSDAPAGVAQNAAMTSPVTSGNAPASIEEAEESGVAQSEPASPAEEVEGEMPDASETAEVPPLLVAPVPPFLQPRKSWSWSESLVRP